MTAYRVGAVLSALVSCLSAASQEGPAADLRALAEIYAQPVDGSRDSALSPDGSKVAFVSTAATAPRRW